MAVETYPFPHIKLPTSVVPTVLQVERLQQSVQEERRRATRSAQSSEAALAAERQMADAAAQEMQVKMQVGLYSDVVTSSGMALLHTGSQCVDTVTSMPFTRYP